MRLTLLVLATVASASTLTPPVLPLIVRNPYLSTWLTDARDEPWEGWPIFWTGHSLGFAVMASVPDTRNVYPLLGRPQDFIPDSDDKFQVSYPKYLGATFDASTTNLTYLIDDSPKDARSDQLKVILSFLSPITPSSTFRQSIPAAYLTVFVQGGRDIDIYVDVNGEWVSGSRDSRIRWDLSEHKTDTGHAAAIKTFKVSRSEEQIFTELDDRAEWGTLHFSAPADVDHEIGDAGRVRREFAREGTLPNRIDGSFRGIFEDEPIFAFSKSFKLGSDANATEGSVMFTFALIRDPIVQFAAARGLSYMRPYWSNFFADADDLIKYHYSDFNTAAKLARNYSAQLSEDAFASGSTEYEEIASLSARQVLGATEFSGTPENPLLFLKEISSNGNCQTVDVIFPSFPFFLYTNPRWLAYLLEPLIEHQLSGQYPNDYSMHDLGLHYPNQTGHFDGHDEYMPLEECGNMLIMGLALVNAFKYDTEPALVTADDGNAQSLTLTRSQKEYMSIRGIDRSPTTRGKKEAKEWVGRAYKLWKKWTGYLVREALVPENQLSTDDFAGWLAYQTNLALKGIIGIRAMSEIADLLGEEEDAKYYRNISDTYVKKWQEYGISRDKTHAKLAYNWYGSWTTLYNLFADSLLCFHVPREKSTQQVDATGWGSQTQQATVKGEESSSDLAGSTFIPDEIYSMQSDWYHNVLQQYGLPLDSRHLYTKSDWEFFAAAISSKSTRKEILGSVAKWLNETETNRPFADLYETEGKGGYPGLEFKARPVVGGHFAFLALERACGGEAVKALEFLEKRQTGRINVQEALNADRAPFLVNAKLDEREMGEL